MSRSTMTARHSDRTDMTKEDFILMHLPTKLESMRQRDRSTIEAIHQLAELYDVAQSLILKPEKTKHEPSPNPTNPPPLPNRTNKRAAK